MILELRSHMTDEQAFARLAKIRLAAEVEAISALGWRTAASCKAAYRSAGSSTTSTFVGGAVGFDSKSARRMHAAPLGQQLAIPCADRSLNQEGCP